uniref:Uncharacterized protein n=1 Tax=Onchocerca volvulus TaxID=6282 RepID=A0A8R1TSX2_ONCVO
MVPNDDILKLALLCPLLSFFSSHRVLMHVISMHHLLILEVNSAAVLVFKMSRSRTESFDFSLSLWEIRNTIKFKFCPKQNLILTKYKLGFAGILCLDDRAIGISAIFLNYLSSDSISSKRNEDTNKEIALITSRQKYHVKLRQFTTYSLKIRKVNFEAKYNVLNNTMTKKKITLQEIGRLPRHINLSAYDEYAVRILNKDLKNIILSFYTLADLIDLSRSLLMLNLLKQLEQAWFFFFNILHLFITYDKFKISYNLSLQRNRFR